MESIRVSPRHLGQMRTGSFCPRCFWYLIAMKFRAPFDMGMPGIMYHLDNFEKRIVEAHFKSHDSAPKWLKKLGCTAPVSFPFKMTQEFPKLGLTLVGMPDAVFTKEDGSLLLVDYKSAKYKGEDDPFLPCYETQLWGYAQLLKANGIGNVTSAALVYFENQLAEYKERPLDLLTNKGLQVPFEVKLHDIEIDLDALLPLMKRFRAYADAATPPEGREGCKNCVRLSGLLDVEQVRRNSEKTLRNVDSSISRTIVQSMYQNRHRSTASGADGWEDYLVDGIASDADSMPAAWDI